MGPFFICHSGFEILGAGNLEAVAQIVKGMENRVVVRNVHDGPVGKYLLIPAVKLAHSLIRVHRPMASVP